MGPINELWEILTLVTVVVLGGLALLVALVRGRGGDSATLPPAGTRRFARLLRGGLRGCCVAVAWREHGVSVCWPGARARAHVPAAAKSAP